MFIVTVLTAAIGHISCSGCGLIQKSLGQRDLKLERLKGIDYFHSV